MDPQAEVVRAGRAAAAAHASLRGAGPDGVAAALAAMARLLVDRAEPVLAANAADVAAAQGSMAPALVDRLRLDAARLERMSAQIEALAGLDDVEPLVGTRDLPGGLVVEERRRPVGVVGANYEARPNVTIDVASQLIKSRNAGVLRTGGAALGSAVALHDEVIRPAMAGAGIDPDAVQLVRSADRGAARALVTYPRLIPLVILRGSGETTAALAREAAAHGVRTLAHAEGGGVLYVDHAADADRLPALVERSLDRLGVCNRLNLLLVAAPRWVELMPAITETLERLGVRPSLPPHGHPLGHEWALDDGNESTVTIAPVEDAAEAARIANEETSGLAAAIFTEDAGAAERFLSSYAGTGAFWNATTRILDGFEMLGAPETGINVDHVPGPRGPVTYRDLHLRQYVVRPA
ncbi:aldehyde dehydrogenase family protein [Miltoncostaea marina]|uniref:aldehyde dehydrogenase family protein n=1 Tax=Miltoncostaea marina TaxID=2843215 RepID=UPI0031B9F30B